MNNQGGCHCGAIRFEVNADPESVCTCYCNTCQKMSGSTSMTAADFKKNNFIFTHGRPAEYHSSPKVIRSFCRDCGSQLTYTNNDFQNNIEVFVGAFDEPSAFPTQLHTWTSQKPNWVIIDDNLPQYSEDQK